MPKLRIAAVIIRGTGLNEARRFYHDGLPYIILEGHDAWPGIVFAFNIGWNPHWRRFGNVEGLKVLPARVAKVLLVGVLTWGDDVSRAVAAIGNLPQDAIAFRAGAVRLVAPFKQQVERQMNAT